MEEVKRKERREREQRENANEFGREVSRIAVTQICESVGFESFNDSALEALTDITIRYLRGLGKTVSFYANLAGRTESNVFDVIQGLEDLGLSRGFSGASEVSHRLTGSGIVREVIEYVGVAEEVPFTRPVPKFPVMRKSSLTPSFVQMGETPAFKHVPAWLPAFPDPHTYVHTPTWNERATSDARADKIELARQRRKAESSLLNLHQRLVVCNGSATVNTSVDESDEGKALNVPKNCSSPPLVMPLQAGERDVLQVNLPANLSANPIPVNHGSVFNTSAPPLAGERDVFLVTLPANLSANAVAGDYGSVFDTSAPPLAGERDVSQVTLPGNLSVNAVPENHGSLVDTSVPSLAGERDVSQFTLPATLSAYAVPGKHGLVFDTSASPLTGERDVQAVPSPAKLSADAVPGNHVSVLDVFAPAIEAMKLSADAAPGSCDSGHVDKKVIPGKRPPIRLKIRTGKRILGESLDLSSRNRNNGIGASIMRDDERDDKKRRAGLILRQAMENPLELTQL